MGIQDLQAFLESGQVEGTCASVDLVRIARSQTNKQVKHKKVPPPLQPFPAPNPNGLGKFNLVVDAECCLDRLYGGFFSDWVCGGQWNRVANFLNQFVTSLNCSNIGIAVFFNGCAEPSRLDEWIAEQKANREKISQVIRHLTVKGTPPPKVWWTAPSCLKPTLRMALRSSYVSVCNTLEDHKLEVIAYCRENRFDAIVADDAEYIAFNPPRYFSARHLKLTYKGTLESKEYYISELMKALQLSTEQLCILSALLGNFLLSESELTDLHKKLNLDYLNKGNDAGSESQRSAEIVQAVVEFVRSLNSKGLDAMGIEIFGVVGGERAAKFKRAVQYYLDGSCWSYAQSNHLPHMEKNAKVNCDDSSDLDPSRLDIGENELEGYISTSEAYACLKTGAPDIVVNKDSPEDGAQVQRPSSGSSDSKSSDEKPLMNGNSHNMLTASSSSSSSGAASPSRQGNVTPVGGMSDKSNVASLPNSLPSAKPKKHVRIAVEEDKISLPPVAAEIMHTVTDRHTKGLMSPLIHQVFIHGEVRLPVVMEDENFKDLPSIQQFYQPMRAMVYAILFNLHHHIYMARNYKNEHYGAEIKVPEIKIKEWVWSKNNQYEKPEMVRAQPLGWGVPTIQRLWFGTTPDDKRRRLRAYLTCMRSDSQIMLNPSYVPQHLLILATVLRYIVACGARILRKHEFEAIIATAIDPQLTNSEDNQEIQLDCVSPRGVQIGALIMTGVEYALLVNDACGAPIPWFMTCPWLFFDGKLLQANLARSASVCNLINLCNREISVAMKAERMREAILDGLSVQWVRPPVHPPVPAPPPDASRVHSVLPVPVSARGGSTRNSHPPFRTSRVARFFEYEAHGVPGCDCCDYDGPGFREVRLSDPPCSIPHRRITTGGRLEIAGVVVGNWGPNSRLQPNVMMSPPQVTSVGVYSGYGGGNAHGSGGGGGGSGGHRGSGFTPMPGPSSKPHYHTNYNKNHQGSYHQRNGGAVHYPGANGMAVNGGGMNNVRGKGRGFVKMIGQNRRKINGPGKKVPGRFPRGVGVGRGITVVSPYTGEVVDASQLTHHRSEMTSAQPAEEGKKMILTNTEPKKVIQNNEGDALNGSNGAEQASSPVVLNGQVSKSPEYSDSETNAMTPSKAEVSKSSENAPTSDGQFDDVSNCINGLTLDSPTISSTADSEPLATPNSVATNE